MAKSAHEAKAHLKEHGWVTIPSVITKEDAARALSRLWEAKSEAESRNETTFVPFLDPNPSNVRLFNLMELDEIFRDLVSHPLAIEMIKAILGDAILISNLSANIARPGSESMALHSDQSLNFPEPWQNISVANVFWCLTDVTKANGATLYIPGSSKWTAFKDVPEDAPKLLVPFDCKAGDIIVIDGRLWHTSGRNVTADEDRAMVFAYYSAPFTRSAVNWTAQLPRDLQESLSEDMKEWLGLAPIGNIPVFGDLRYMSQQYPQKSVGQNA